MMFNESFMFFWLVSIADGARGVAVLATFPLLILAVICSTIGRDARNSLLNISYCETQAGKDEAYKKIIKDSFRATRYSMYGAVFCCAAGVLIPPERALMAGGAQYVVEAAEVDETLKRIKVIFDNKLSEIETGDQE